MKNTFLQTIRNYTIKSVVTLYEYGFLASYGMGFGGPLLLQQVIDPNIDCGLEDFRILIDRYDLQAGLAHFFPRYERSFICQSMLGCHFSLLIIFYKRKCFHGPRD